MSQLRTRREFRVTAFSSWMLVVIVMAISLMQPMTALANSIEHMGIDSTYTSAGFLNMGRQQMLDKTKEMESKGFRVADIVSYNHSNSIRYSVVMAMDEDRAYRWDIKARVALAQVDGLVESQRLNGFRPAAISVAEDSRRGWQLATLHFVKDRRFDRSVVVTAYKPQEFQDQFTRLVGQNYRPIHLHAYTNSKGQVFLSAIYVRDGLTTRDWAARIGWNRTTLERQLEVWRGRRFRPISLTSYVSEGETRYAIVFIRNQRQTPWSLVLDRTYEEFWAAQRTQLSNGLRLFGIGSRGGGQSRHSGIFVGQSPNTITAQGSFVRTPALQELDTDLQGLIQGTATSAMSVAVMYQGRLVFARGYTNAPVGFSIIDPNTQFRIGSVSKTLTGAAILALQDQGRLKLSDSALSYVNETELDCRGFAAQPRWNRRMRSYEVASYAKAYDLRLGSLMRHHSGLKRNWETETIFPGGRRMDTRDHVRSALCQKPDKTLETVAKGGGYYSNPAYMLLGMVIENASGMSYEEYVKRTLLRPLGMNRTVPGRSAKYLAYPNEVTYQRNDWTEIKENVDWTTRQNNGPPQRIGARYTSSMHGGGIQYENIRATGGWVSTPVDLLRFARGILSNSSPLSVNARAIMAEVPTGFAKFYDRVFFGISNIRDGEENAIARDWPYGNAGFSIRRANPGPRAWQRGSLGKGGTVKGARAWLEFSEDAGLSSFSADPTGRIIPVSPAYGFAFTVNYDTNTTNIQRTIRRRIQKLNTTPQDRQNLYDRSNSRLFDFFSR